MPPKAKRVVSRFRLAVNGLGCLAIAALMLPPGFRGLAGWVSGERYFGRDPDGADKVLAIELLGLVIGAIALVSLVRTAKAWFAPRPPP